MKMPYTEALMASIPKLDDPSHTRLLRTIPGRPPDLVNPPQRLPRSRPAARTSGNAAPRRSRR